VLQISEIATSLGVGRSSIMKEPRRSWRKLIASLGIRPGSDEETQLIGENFPGLNVATFRCDLSRGFSAELSGPIEKLCDTVGFEFLRENWIRASTRKGPGGHESIRYVGRNIRDSASFYEELLVRYRGAERYDAVRVGGLFSRNRDSLIVDDGGFRPSADSKRLPYVKLFWARMKQKALKGNAVHVVRTIDRLVELWACAEALRDEGLHEVNRVYLAPVTAPPAPQDYPVMGVRIIDGRWTLQSIPAPKLGESRYSSWIDSERLAEFAGRYVQWARLCSSEITSLPTHGIEDMMSRAFKALQKFEADSANYGPIRTFAEAKAVKNEMLELVRKGSWYPVVA
jgi:hypothetical protein